MRELARALRQSNCLSNFISSIIIRRRQFQRLLEGYRLRELNLQVFPRIRVLRVLRVDRQKSLKGDKVCGIPLGGACLNRSLRLRRSRSEKAAAMGVDFPAREALSIRLTPTRRSSLSNNQFSYCRDLAGRRYG